MSDGLFSEISEKITFGLLSKAPNAENGSDDPFYGVMNYFENSGIPLVLSNSINRELILETEAICIRYLVTNIIRVVFDLNIDDFNSAFETLNGIIPLCKYNVALGLSICINRQFRLANKETYKAVLEANSEFSVNRGFYLWKSNDLKFDVYTNSLGENIVSIKVDKGNVHPESIVSLIDKLNEIGVIISST